jgi:hypothetical protein
MAVLILVQQRGGKIERKNRPIRPPNMCPTHTVELQKLMGNYCEPPDHEPEIVGKKTEMAARDDGKHVSAASIREGGDKLKPRGHHDSGRKAKVEVKEARIRNSGR